eukprot:scaffold1973_cov399-Prasinococcus_capsulatus_cf.AAC.1
MRQRQRQRRQRRRHSRRAPHARRIARGRVNDAAARATGARRGGRAGVDDGGDDERRPLASQPRWARVAAAGERSLAGQGRGGTAALECATDGWTRPSS